MSSTIAEAPPPAKTGSKNGGPPTLNANELRRLAEWADGMRGRRLKLAIKNGEVVLVEQGEPGDPLLYLNTDLEGGGCGGTGKIQIHWHKAPGEPERDGDSGCRVDDADAVFVSQSAIEKFVLPYYLRFKSPSEVQSIKEHLFNDKRVIAVIHFPPSVWSAFPESAALMVDVCLPSSRI